MALVTFVNDSEPYLNAENLNNNFNEVINYANQLNTYSTSEIVIGTWIDGKPLYRKVFNCGVLPNNTDKLIDTGLTNITPIKLYGYAHSTINNVTITLPDVNPSGIQYCIRLYYDGTNNKISIATKDDRTPYSGYVILEYTKTTD